MMAKSIPIKVQADAGRKLDVMATESDIND